jgi:uncharacterized repeat protein (TIGR03803 family)
MNSSVTLAGARNATAATAFLYQVCHAKAATFQAMSALRPARNARGQTKSDLLIGFAGAFACTCVLHVPAASAATETTLYSFCHETNCSDGENPQASLLDINGTLYGTTTSGGAYGAGTVFLVGLNGFEKVLHSFGKGSDGANPQAALIDVKNLLYGTTVSGGAYANCSGHGCGTAFSVSLNGDEKVRHSFGSAGDGTNPTAGLVAVSGTFYGTTSRGGTESCSDVGTCGTVFSVTPAGTEKVLYSFKGGSDGFYPEAPLIDVKGTFYGTTYAGAGTGCSNAIGCGSAFSITADGHEDMLYAFKGGSDGGNPLAGLIGVKGRLYGTTYEIGGPGSVFSMTLNGTETVLYSFCQKTNCSDGTLPAASLLDVNGTLYGTTTGGGAYGHGTVFSITLRGTERVLHSFKGGSDGANPQGGLIDVNGKLYGTTAGGGTYKGGTVFSIKP